MPISNKNKLINFDKVTDYVVNHLRPYNQDMVTAKSLIVEDKIAEIHPVIYRAIDMLFSRCTFGFGTDDSGKRFLPIEFISESSDPDYIALVSHSGIKFSRIVDGFPENFLIESDDTYSDEKNLELQFVLASLLLNFAYINADQEVATYLFNLSKPEELSDVDYNNSIAVVCDYVYRKLIGRAKTVNLGSLDKFALNSAKKFEPSSIKANTSFVYFNKNYKPSVKRMNRAEDVKFGTVELTEDEKKLVPTIPEWFVEPDQLSQVVDLIKLSTGTIKPKRNFMFRGPSSTGKTTLAKAVAAKLGKPYVYLTCSADTESYDFLGQPMYDSEGKVKFIESPFITAIKKGYVVEIQEPYVIAKQGVLTALNGLLDDSNGITLSTGEYVERHPDTVVILTTNVNYVGCRMPNQSVVRRMNAIYDIDMPGSQEIKDRIIATTGFDNKSLLNSMVDVFYQINNHLEKEDITDGVCTVSELIDWASATMILNSVTDAAQFTVVSKSTCDLEAQATVAQLVSATLEGVSYK